MKILWMNLEFSLAKQLRGGFKRQLDEENRILRRSVFIVG